MSTYTLGYDDKYECPNCAQRFDDADMLIKNCWKCPVCGGEIYIKAPRLNGGHVMIRKLVSELRKYDLVHVSGKFIYPVIAVEQINSQKVGVALKGYGVETYKANDYVSVIIGGMCTGEY